MFSSPDSVIWLTPRKFAFLIVAAAQLAGFDARAYETDQLSGRHLTPPDSTERVDAYVNAALERARARAERKIRRWKAKGSRAGRMIRKEIIREFPFNYLAFGAPIEKWMTEELSKEGFAVEPDGVGRGWSTNIYDQYRRMFTMDIPDFPSAAMVFHFALGVNGTYIAPTFVSGGVRYGADKWSHFFRLGYRYWKRSKDGTDDAAAIRYGTGTELGGVGYATSGAFSYADLAANYDGYLFYRDVFGTPDAYFVLENGRLVQRRPFASRDYVSHDWDEYLNPNVYRPRLREAIRLHLEGRREEVCAEYAVWGAEASAVAALLRPRAVYADLTRAPEQEDPFALDALCSRE